MSRGAAILAEGRSSPDDSAPLDRRPVKFKQRRYRGDACDFAAELTLTRD